MDDGSQVHTNPKRIQIGRSTYVTRLHGRLVTVRERRATASNFSLDDDLISGPFSKRFLKSRSNSSQSTNNDVSPMTTPSTSVQEQATLGLPTMSPVPTPLPGLYQCGNQQLLLLPVGTGQIQNLPHKSSIGYYTIPSLSPRITSQAYTPEPGHTATNPSMMLQAVAPPTVASTFVVVDPLCAGCGRIRSCKYRHENPIKPGEIQTPSYCRKCQRQGTSTESSHESETEPRRQRRDKRERRKKKRITKIEACFCTAGYRVSFIMLI